MAATTSPGARRGLTAVRAGAASLMLLFAGLVLAEPPPRAGPAAPVQVTTTHPDPSARTTTTVERTRPDAALPVPAPLTGDGLDLRAGPVTVPLRLQMPTLGVDATVLGVGMTPTDAMDAPMGRADDPVWQQAFWYRGSAIPGTPSTALMAGHVNDPEGRPGVFGAIGTLRPGDPLVVHDTRSGLDVRFSVTTATTYALEDTDDPAVLTQIYGAGPVAGTGPLPSADGLSHLTLITCAGTFRSGTHDHRLVVHAIRV